VQPMPYRVLISKCAPLIKATSTYEHVKVTTHEGPCP